jgi:hypothetical protein
MNKYHIIMVIFAVIGCCIIIAAMPPPPETEIKQSVCTDAGHITPAATVPWLPPGPLYPIYGRH